MFRHAPLVAALAALLVALAFARGEPRAPLDGEPGASFPVDGACAAEDPQPLFFTTHQVAMFWDGCATEWAYATLPRFNGGGRLVRVELDLDVMHEQRIGVTNYDATPGHYQVADFGDDTGVAGDCPSTSRVTFELPSGFVIQGHEATWPWLRLAVAPYGTLGGTVEDLEYDAFSFRYSEPADPTLHVTMRREVDWAGMVGPGYWTLNAHHSGQFGYADLDGAECRVATCGDWWPRPYGQPYALLVGYTDQISVMGALRYVWTTDP